MLRHPETEHEATIFEFLTEYDREHACMFILSAGLILKILCGGSIDPFLHHFIVHLMHNLRNVTDFQTLNQTKQGKWDN